MNQEPSSPAFEGVVYRPNPPRSGFSRNGTDVPIVGWLADPARDIPCSQFEALQAANNGELEIVHAGGRVLIEQHVTVCSQQGALSASRKLAHQIKEHLGLSAMVQ